MRIAVLFCVVILPFLCQAAFYRGSLQTNSGWHFLGKFCFAPDAVGQEGKFEYSIVTTNKNLSIMLYLGDTNWTTPGAWGPVYQERNSLTCQQLVDLHRGNGLRRVVSGVTDQMDTTQYAHAYFWFVAVADCETGNLNIESYTLEFTNPGGLWEKQFSYDEQGVTQYIIFFTIAFFLLFAVHVWGVWQLVRIESWHPLIKAFSIAVIFAFLATIFELLHYTIYMYNGVGNAGLQSVGELLTMAYQLILVFVCLLISKGWAITTMHLTDRNIIIIVFTVFVVAYLSLFIVDTAARDPASTLYFYDSIPGLIVVLLRVALTVWFVWNLFKTVKLELLPEKRRFYYVFGVLFTLWLMFLPILVALAMVLDPWYRFRTVDGLTLASDLLAFIVLQVFLWPTRIYQYFNVKTTPQLLSVDGANSYGAVGMADEL